MLKYTMREIACYKICIPDSVPENMEDISINHFVLSTNFLFKFNVSLPLVIGELLQNTVDVNNVTYKLYNIKLERLPVLLNTKNYLSTGQAIT